MYSGENHLHFVYTPKEAMVLIKSHNQFWVSNCGCREQRGFCTRSRTNLCLMFYGGPDASGSGKKEITYLEVEEILKEARDKHLVARPFRDFEKKKRVEGICFCCDDCCGYFLDKSEVCDKGDYVEKTFMEECTHCGICAEVCYFEGRKMVGGTLLLTRENCYGCGLCREICPEDCIVMMPRSLELV